MIKKNVFVLMILAVALFSACANESKPNKHRILISTDIGGTDPDDNQSMDHLLMYSDKFDIEGLASPPFGGKGSKEEILRMIDLYEQDFAKLKSRAPELMEPNALRALCKQGRNSATEYQGFSEPSEGSEWIVKCARKESDKPLWVLVWGGLDDVAQALHDAPDIAEKIRVYWIGGPNKKWGVNCYNYIAANFPNLWIIENNASYRGFIGDSKKNKRLEMIEDYQSADSADAALTYYDRHMKDAGHLGKDFKNYYDGNIKMGDTPSLLYMMNGDPNDPTGESWGGSFEKIKESPKYVFTNGTTLEDTVAVYAVVEFFFTAPDNGIPVGTKCFTFRIDKQDWQGVYLGNGTYGVRYACKAPATLDYAITSDIKELDGLKGEFVVSKEWPGKHTENAYKLGDNWYSDRQAAQLFDGKWQGSKTISKWREDVLADWAERWSWLK